MKVELIDLRDRFKEEKKPINISHKVANKVGDLW